MSVQQSNSPTNLGSLADVRTAVEGSNGVMSFRAGDLRDAFGAGRLSSGVRSAITRELLGLGLDRLWTFQLSSTGISELEFRDDWTALHRMNTLVHLDAVPADR